MKSEIILSIIVIIVASGFIAAGVRYIIVRNRKISEWERDELANPEKYLADDEIVFVKYKNEIIPLRAIEKIQWDKMNGTTKREYWLSLQRALKKGQVKKVIMEDGKPMYIPTSKGREIKHFAELYEKLKEGV